MSQTLFFRVHGHHHDIGFLRKLKSAGIGKDHPGSLGTGKKEAQRAIKLTTEKMRNYEVDPDIGKQIDRKPEIG